jgi:transcriptional regulator of acetoin/glycerol metabolism
VLVLAEPTNDGVRERWARALRLGLRPQSHGYPAGTSDADLNERRERLDDALREERDLLEPIVAQLATDSRVVIVADREGVILSTRADRHGIDPVARARLVAGARWGEETRGTNAIGTAIAEGRAVAVIGAAHFEERNRGIFCYATPIRDAYGELVAVLDVSGPLESHDPSIGASVQTAGLAVERALRAMAYGDRRSGAFAAIERLVHRTSGPELLVEATGVVRVVNLAARAALTLDDGQTLTCERALGISFAELVAAAAQRGGMRFETREGTWRIAVDPIAGAGDRTLAVLVHFTAEHVERAPVSPPQPSRATSPAPPASSAFAAILGQDPGLVEAKHLAARFASTSLPVLLLAETGTGKELFARAIHEASDRSSRPFVAVNCGALSPALIASELFGYSPGAFTGAARTGSEGRIGAAHGGTLFLDEIGEMPDALQAALLRVLDDGFYQRVGETRERRAEFRVVCATCRDLPAMVADGRFRSDLFYRIRGAYVTLPALRDRSDTVWLAERLLEKLAPAPAPRLSREAARWIGAHPWPGNVRELKSAVVHALALCDAGSIGVEHLPRSLPAAPVRARAEPTTRREIVRDAIDAALGACAGNVSEAARRLGVGRGTIYRAVRDRKAE